MSENSPTKNLPLDKLYDDLIHPSAEAVGIMISIPFRLVRQKLSNIEKYLIEGEKNLDRISESISEKLSDTNPENIVEPEPYIVVPALQGISYCMDNDELRTLYANLLATAMQKDKKDSVLPAFAEIIKQMSPVDALLMQSLTPNDMYPLAEVRFQRKTSAIFSSYESFKPFQGGISIFQNLSDILDDLYPPDKIAVSIENLARLGLIEISDTYIVDESCYNGISAMPYCMECQTELEAAKTAPVPPKWVEPIKDSLQDYEFSLIPKNFFMTNLGKLFFDVCIC